QTSSPSSAQIDTHGETGLGLFETLIFLQVLREMTGVGHIVLAAHGDHRLVAIGDFLHHLGRRAHHQGIVRDLHAFRHQSVGADNAIAAYLGAVQYHRVHADQGVVADGAAMQHDFVADRDVLADFHRHARIHVQHRVFLHIAVVADLDDIVIRADHHAKPDTGVFTQHHGPDQGGVGRNPLALATEFQLAVVNRIDHFLVLALTVSIVADIETDIGIVNVIDQIQDHERGQPPDPFILEIVVRHAQTAAVYL